uniref:Uncharacterized protein n=1 Tax=Photinus pyralis TaxID=7054 RepID=A0A1Y1KAI9_PHOPY
MMDLANVLYNKGNLLNGTAVACAIVACKIVQTKLRDQLVYGYDKANGADKSTQKGAAQYAVQETQPRYSCNQYRSSRHTSYNPTDLGMDEVVILSRTTTVDALLHNRAYKQRAGSLWTNNHLRR